MVIVSWVVVETIASFILCNYQSDLHFILNVAIHIMQVNIRDSLITNVSLSLSKSGDTVCEYNFPK